METLIDFSKSLGKYDFTILMFLLKASLVLFFIIAIVIAVYDRFIQRENQLLISYPLIGRLRYLFYLLRDPMRQYFGDEKFYESFDKVKWVCDAAKGTPPYSSFSTGQPQRMARLSIKNANCVLNSEEVCNDFKVTFGESSLNPFTTKSVLGRSAMSDGSISPEGTRAFAKGAFIGGFPINTGEGGLTSNFIYTHGYHDKDNCYLSVKEGTFFAKGVYKIIKFLLNKDTAEKVYKHIVIYSDIQESYLFDEKRLICYRIDWEAPLESFPKNVPTDIPDIIFQLGSGLYGARNKEGQFDELRYEKVMRFAKMTEIKIAQGAKQTGGKLLKSKVTETIAYYRGVEPYEDIISPNAFPYGKTLEELFDFVGRLKTLSQKPVGIKIVISSKENFEAYAQLIKKRVEANSPAYPDFITIDGANGGTGAAPLEMMMSVGMVIAKALYIADSTLKQYGIRDKVKLIASEKVLTPDDAVVLFGVGADFVAIARAFMLSVGCIRARECAGNHGRSCPVGLATQDKKRRASFLVEKNALGVASYHQQMTYGLKGLLAIMGIDNLNKIDKTHILFKDDTGKTYLNVDKYFEESIIE